jgi:hypothetical protein
VNPDRTYLGDVIAALEHIREICPADLAERFGAQSGIGREDFLQCSPASPGRLAAVDGSNAMILESGSFSLAAVRAVVSCFAQDRREFLRSTSTRLVKIEAREGYVARFAALYREYFGEEPQQGLAADDPARAIAVVREMVEFAAAREALESLEEGDTLLLDGSLRVGHASHLPVLRELLFGAGNAGIRVAGISKRTSATWGGGYPLVLAVDMFATHAGIRSPWCVRIPEEVLDQTPHAQWQRGVPYVARFHEKGETAFKIEVPDYADEHAAIEACSACAAYAGDGRIPGYPYPLLDAHRAVVLGADEVEQITCDIIKGMNSLGMNSKDFWQLFGDYHEAFARY